MPVGIYVTVKGLEKVNMLMNVLPQVAKQKIKNELQQIVRRIRDEAKQRCPVETGALQKSVRVKTYSKPAGLIEKIGVSAGGYIINPKTGRLVDYAGYVEYGTSRNPPQPFLRPAFENNERHMKRFLQQSLIEAVRSLIH